MYRKITGFLEAWKENEHRKPLILQGARQVGKTWIMKEFGRQYYESYVYFNFDEEDELNELLYFLNHKGRRDMKGSRGKVLDYEDLKINAVYRSVECRGEQVRLTNYEFEILYLLARNPGQVFSKEQIYTRVWKEPYYGAEDNVISLIRRIRKKIEPDSAKPQYILNVWGIGYKFNKDLVRYNL